MAASADLFDALQQFFDVCLEAVADTPDGAPDCAYICSGPPAWDTMPCLMVHVGGPTIADTLPLAPFLNPGQRIAVTGEVNLVSFTATILRCAVTLDDDGVPGHDWDDRHRNVAQQTCADLWALWNHVRQAKRDGTLFPGSRREMFIEPAIALNQEGGATGWQFTVRSELDGYNPHP